MLTEAVAPLDLTPPPCGEEAALRDRLRERSLNYTAAEKRHSEAEASLRSSQGDEKAGTVELAKLRDRTAKIRELAGDDPLPDQGTLTFTSLDKAADAVGRLQLEANSSSTAAIERQRALDQARKERSATQAALVKALTESPFPDPEALRAARLSSDEGAKAEALDKAISDETQQLKGALAGARSNIEKLRAKSPPEGDALTQLRKTHGEAESANDLLANQCAELGAALKTDDDLRAKQKSTARQLAEERSQLVISAQLAALIGSHDGKKFRVFAQGLSLDLLLRHANRHLERLNPRYQLSRSASEELGLEIVDLFQASARRPMASLSGGESFLASLALALGLSDLAGRKVQIDSLFIDEGFGSLDTETLDTALSALESLRLQEKTVGVISHVEMLKERIGVQIAVERQADGGSGLRISSR
jgi:exonuclease SbcC